jgi:hypothetical protein
LKKITLFDFKFAKKKYFWKKNHFYIISKKNFLIYFKLILRKIKKKKIKFSNIFFWIIGF